MIKAILIDLDGVYFPKGKHEFADNVVKKYNVDKQLVHDWFIKGKLMDQYKKDEISGDKYWTFVINKWNIKSSPKEMIQLLQSGYEINSELKQLFPLIRKKGCKIITCTNNFKERIEALEQKFHFLADFDLTIFSYKEKMLKPELFNKIFEKLSLNPEEILIVDDGDKATAMRKKGFNVLIVKPGINIKNELIKLGLL